MRLHDAWCSGLSGGIDSALTAAIAAEALGADHVLGVLMPSPYSSRGSVDDSLAAGRQPRHRDAHAADRAGDAARWTARCATPSPAPPRDVTEENIQARIRGNLLMALSNKRGALLLTTGNKSELAVGYCTLYGDMSGGLAVIADVPKTMVYRVARWLNDSARSADHPGGDPDQSAVRRAAAEPDRPGLAAALRRARRHPAAPHRAAPAGRRDHRRRLRRRHRPSRAAPGPRLAEFKRKQAAPGLKVTDRAFGTGWRMPIAANELRSMNDQISIQIAQEIIACALRRAKIPSYVRRPATAGASTATARDGAARTSRARRCSAA